VPVFVVPVVSVPVVPVSVVAVPSSAYANDTNAHIISAASMETAVTLYIAVIKIRFFEINN
jgi:hypothetical protein